MRERQKRHSVTTVVGLGLLLIVFGEVNGSQVAHLTTREGRRLEVDGGIDFSTAEFDPDSGKRCIIKMEEVDTLKKEPILQCTHK